MESPVDSPSNIYAIDNVPEFNWVLFAHSLARPESLSDLFTANVLQLRESQLRQKGAYTYLDRGTDHLWVFFSPSSQSLDDILNLPSPQEEVAAVLRGSLKATDLASQVKAHGEDSSSAHGGHSANGEQSNMTIDGHDSQHHNEQKYTFNGSDETRLPSVGELRIILLLAVRMTCSDMLMQSGRFLSLGSGSFCVTPQRSVGRDDEFQSSHFFKLKATTSLWSLSCCWLSNGSLLVSSRCMSNKHLRGLGRNESSETVILAPYGWLVTTNSDTISMESGHVQSALDTTYSSGMPWRSNCLDSLKRDGINVRNGSSWTAISYKTDILNEHADSLEWPQELCFVLTDRPSSLNSMQSDGFSNPMLWKDALDEASSWMEDTKARESLIQEQLHNKLSNSRSEKLQRDEYIPSHLRSRSEDTADTQNLAGIYPTPPEVTRIHGHLPSDSSLNLPLNVDDANLIDHKDDATIYATPNLDTATETIAYDSMKDDDLFGTIDEGMDADNGVTEDDFRFFDEPDEMDEVTMEIDPFVAEGPKMVDTKDGIASPEPSTADYIVADQNMMDDIVADEDMGELNVDNSDSNGKQTEKESLTVDGLEETGKVLEEDASAPKSSKSRRVQIISSPTIHLYDEISIASPDNDIESLDDKYAARGKFASNHHQHPSTARPNISVSMERNVPKIQDTLTTSSSSSSETSSPEYTAPDNSDIYSTQSTDRSASVNPVRDIFRRLHDTRTDLQTLMFNETGPESMNTASVSPTLLETQGHAFIQLAQIVADQSVSFKYLTRSRISRDEDDDSLYVYSSIRHILTQNSHKVQVLSLKECAHIELDAASTMSDVDEPTLLPTSTVRIKRGESIIDISFAATIYWKELGLQPLSDGKDVTAFCLCPDIIGSQRGAASFLRNVSALYRSLNLGIHSLGTSDTESLSFDNGVVPITGLETYIGYSKEHITFCSTFGKVLSDLNQSEGTILIYIVHPSNGSISLKEPCLLFQRIFEVYASSHRKSDHPREIVLQIIPSTLILPGITRTLTYLKQYTDVCKIVYNRCPSESSSRSAYASQSMIQLTESLPTRIEFKISQDSSTSLLGRSEAFHLAWSHKEGERWLSVALTDGFGRKQWSASYAFGHNTDSATSLSAITQEIFDIIQDAADDTKNYKLFLVKTSTWSALETETWKQTCLKDRIPLFMLVYTFEPHLVISVMPKSINMDTLEKHQITMPMSLEASSPDAGGGKSEEKDHISRLVDTNNQAWWIPCKEVLISDNNILTSEAHLASGYLSYKNRSLMGLFVQYSTCVPESLSIVETFHGLITLARARCLEDNLPCHLAIAEASQEGVLRSL